MINRRGFLASALALGLAVALPLAPRPVRRWIASARARWARRRMWGDLGDAQIAGMVRRHFPVYHPRQPELHFAYIENARADDGVRCPDYLGKIAAGEMTIAQLPTLPYLVRDELERTYQQLWGRERAQALREYHDRLPLDDPRFGRRT